MAAKKANAREAREARERLRAYRARQSVHERGVRRRRRDNLIAAIGVVVVVGLAVAAQLAYFSAGPGATAAAPTGTPTPTASAAKASCPPKPDSANTGSVPSPSLSQCRTWTGTMVLNKDVRLGISLDGAAAPQAVASTVSLVKKHFYAGLTCHRLTDGGFYVLQCGDPKGDGTGGPGYSYGPIENAPSDNSYPAGTIAMARTQNDAASQGSQFFIVYRTTTIPADQAGGYTVIGRVTSGLPELRSTITDKGVKAGTGSSAHDGKPVVPTSITSITLR